MKSANSKPSDYILVLTFNYNLKKSRSGSGNRKRVAVWFFHHFMNEPAKAALVHRMLPSRKPYLHQKGKNTYCQLVSYLLAMYPTDNLMAEAEAEEVIFVKPDEMSVVGYKKVL